jgi:hypothetical protein
MSPSSLPNAVRIAADAPFGRALSESKRRTRAFGKCTRSSRSAFCVPEPLCRKNGLSQRGQVPRAGSSWSQ